MICPDCRGSGETVASLNAHRSDYNLAVSCSLCGGEGHITGTQGSEPADYAAITRRAAVDAFYRCDRERLTAIEERDAALEKLRRIASLVTDCGQHDCHETCRNSADWIRRECAQ